MRTTEVDWTRWYLTDEEDMGQSPRHHEAARRFESILRSWAKEQGWTDVLVGSDAFFAWVPTHPLVRISPDVYLLHNPPDPLPDGFQVWRPRQSAPRFALEIVSEDWRKDYRDNPPKYAQLGVQELVIYDPDCVSEPQRGRMPLQVYNRTEDDMFVRYYTGDGPVFSAELGTWLVIADQNGPVLRLARDLGGRHLIPDAEEAAAKEQERAEREQERAEKEKERAEKEQERAEKERAARLEAESELARLREELSRLRDRSTT